MAEAKFAPIFVTKEWLSKITGHQMTDLAIEQLVDLGIIRLGQLERAALPNHLSREHCSNPEEDAFKALFRGLEEIDRTEEILLENIKNGERTPTEIEEDWETLDNIRVYRRRQYAVLMMKIVHLELFPQPEAPEAG